MATDEMLLQSIKEPTVRIYDWQEPTISLGKLQKSTDVKALAPIIRRPTGGRAVYHDSTTEITYAIIRKAVDEKISYQENCQVIIDVLQKLGVAATRQANGDITVEGKKISGNAQVYHNGNVLQHGTLLIEQQDFKKAADILQIKPEELAKRTTYLNIYVTISKKEVERLFLKLGKEQELRVHEKDLRNHLLETKYLAKTWNESGILSKGACYIR